MSFLFQHWLEEKSEEQKYNEIIGVDLKTKRDNLESDIEKSLESNFTSRLEREKLLDLYMEIKVKNSTK